MADDQINKKINKLLSKADDLLEKNYSETELNVLSGYKYSLTEIRKEITLLFEKYGTNPSLATMRKYNRLEKLEKQLTEILEAMQGKEINSTTSEIKNSMQESFERSGQVINDVADLGFDFIKVPKESLDYILKHDPRPDIVKNHSAGQKSDIQNESENILRKNVKEEIAYGMAKGSSYANIIKSLREKFNITAESAKTIVQDQMHAGHMAGRNEGFNRAIAAGKRLGLRSEKVWKHNASEHPCLMHIAMDGVPSDEDGIFTLPDGTRTEAPGLTGDPKHDEHCHCYMGFNIIMKDGRRI